MSHFKLDFTSNRVKLKGLDLWGLRVDFESCHDYSLQEIEIRLEYAGMKLIPLVAILLLSFVCASCVGSKEDPLLETIDRSQAAIINLEEIEGSLGEGVSLQSIDGTKLRGIQSREQIEIAPGRRIFGLSFSRGEDRFSGCVEADLKPRKEYRLSTQKVKVGESNFLHYSRRGGQKTHPQ